MFAIFSKKTKDKSFLSESLTKLSNLSNKKIGLLDFRYQSQMKTTLMKLGSLSDNKNVNTYDQ